MTKADLVNPLELVLRCLLSIHALECLHLVDGTCEGDRHRMYRKGLHLAIFVSLMLLFRSPQAQRASQVTQDLKQFQVRNDGI